MKILKEYTKKGKKYKRKRDLVNIQENVVEQDRIWMNTIRFKWNRVYWMNGIWCMNYYVLFVVYLDVVVGLKWVQVCVYLFICCLGLSG